VADPRGVPKRQGRRSAGNSVEEKTLKTGHKGMNMLETKASMPPSGDPAGVSGIGEAVDERWW